MSDPSGRLPANPAERHRLVLEALDAQIARAFQMAQYGWLDKGEYGGLEGRKRILQRHAPALAAHVVGRHPDSALAGELRAYAAAPRPAAPVVEAPTLDGVVGNLVRAACAAEDDAAVARVAEAIWLHGGGER